MKKTWTLLIVIFSSMLLMSCRKGEKDTVKPLLIGVKESVEIEVGEPFDLLKGITAFDDIDLDITEKIIVDDDGFDNFKPGVYFIKYSVSDSAGNKTEKTTILTVKPIPTYSEGYSHVEIFTGKINGEKPAPETHNCFPGDWSRKAESSFDKWLGMEGTITLPYFKGDKDRFGKLPMNYDWYLDNPSIYFGGNAGYESDVGLSWEIGALPNGKVSDYKFTFRPIWRYIHRGENIWNNANNYNAYNFYFPGDTLRLSLFSPKPHTLQLKVEVISITKDPEYVKLREEYGIHYPHDFLSPEFPSIGHGVFDARFMRVNAIDQYYNEGKTSKPTNAEVNNAIWHEVYLYREIDGNVYKVPFTSERYVEAYCPLKSGFITSYEGVDKSKGGEVVYIRPGNVIE